VTANLGETWALWVSARRFKAVGEGAGRAFQPCAPSGTGSGSLKKV
jgi:hypothetical protein